MSFWLCREEGGWVEEMGGEEERDRLGEEMEKERERITNSS